MKKLILFSEHAARDKNLTREDVDIIEQTIREGKTDPSKTQQNRVCFKRYDKQSKITYFVIAEPCPDFIKIITVIKKKGKH